MVRLPLSRRYASSCCAYPWLDCTFSLYAEGGNMAASHEYASELRRIREHLRLTQDELGQVLGVQGNSIMRYEKQFRKVPEPIIRLARQLVRREDIAHN
jgi:DNA-binding XRE family transcriptional regulator